MPVLTVSDSAVRPLVTGEPLAELVGADTKVRLVPDPRPLPDWLTGVAPGGSSPSAGEQVFA
jgi:hypothetical protein